MKRIDKDFLFYDGEHFEIEFYYEESGNISIWDDFVSLSEKDQLAFLVRVKKLGDSKPGTIHPKTIFNLEDDKNKIWAIKFGSNRFCSFFYDGGKIIITNAYKKQTQKNGKREIAQIKKAATMKTDYERRVRKNTYYLESED